MERTVVIGLLLLGSVSGAVALTNEEANRFKEAALHGSVKSIKMACPKGYRLGKVVGPTCVLTLRILINDLDEKGHDGHSYCPPADIEYRSFYDAITQYIILENPDSTERARDVALRALMRAYPCKR